MFRFSAWCVVFVCLSCGAAQAQVRLPAFFSEHMVLQRDIPLPIWGWATAGEKVAVQLGAATATTTADAQGRWKVVLPALPAGGPLELTVSGKNTLKVSDILIGEVWLCSGQSNMEWIVWSSSRAAEEIAAADFPQIRHIKIPQRAASAPQEDVDASWQVCSPATAGNFTACGYFMARKLHQELKVPVGLINSSWGGTRIEPWTPPAGFREVPELRDLQQYLEDRNPESPVYHQRLQAFLTQMETWLTQSKAKLAKNEAVAPNPQFPAELSPPSTHTDPTTLYNGMIHPLVGYPLRGAIWYQGESNSGEGMLYLHKMQALIRGWRHVWQLGPFPFFYVQIAPFQYGATQPTILPEFWEAQAAALAIPGTGMVVTNDIATVNDIHPPNKQDVGLRFALLALRRVYGQANVVDSGAELDSITPEGNQLRVKFKNTAGGLKSRDGAPLTHFEIIDANSDWTPAKVTIDGDCALLSAAGVAQPTAMRFAWHKLAEPNLVNGAGLPTSAFRAGQLPKLDFTSKVPELSSYKLVYDLDLLKLAKTANYDVDNHASLTGPFDRVAYLVELSGSSAPRRYLYVSMDSFTDDLGKIGIPDLSSGASFERYVKNLTVQSNAPGITNGTSLDGNIEFYPNNYSPANANNIPGASATAFDFGDTKSEPAAGYGCMQVHNYKAGQTLFAINHFDAGRQADIGIGNSDGPQRDWTFTASASALNAGRLRVYVRQKTK